VEGWRGGGEWRGGVVEVGRGAQEGWRRGG